MRIATLQFAPLLGQVEQNISKTDAILKKAESDGRLRELDILVLPEMAFSGYNHPSLSAIKPYLEPTASGISTAWAKKTAARLQCIVAVGYPERTVLDPQPALQSDLARDIASNIGDVSVVDALPVSDFEPSYYNALVFVSPSGQMLAHYRKTFLYYTDEIWASENTDGFFSGDLPFRAPKLTNARQTRPSSISDACGDGGAEMKVAAGICMDINPYQFKAPWTAYEFASHCIRSQARLVVLSMAWLTRLPAEAIEMDQHNPDWNTVGYWIERFAPLLTHKSDNVHYETRQDETTHGKSSNEQAPQQRGDKESKEQVIVIFANRTGFEGTAPLIGDVRYAGSSAVMSMTRPQTRNEGGEIGMWDILGRGVEDVLVVDTEEDPKYGLKMRQKADDSGDEDTSEDSNEVLDV